MASADPMLAAALAPAVAIAAAYERGFTAALRSLGCDSPAAIQALRELVAAAKAAARADGQWAEDDEEDTSETMPAAVEIAEGALWDAACAFAALARRTAEVEMLRGILGEWLDNYAQWAQLIDGWRQDGSDWSKWDEETREKMAQLAMRMAALAAPEDR